jgi:hypothetical protein
MAAYLRRLAVRVDGNGARAAAGSRCAPAAEGRVDRASGGSIPCLGRSCAPSSRCVGEGLLRRSASPAPSNSIASRGREAAMATGVTSGGAASGGVPRRSHSAAEGHPAPLPSNFPAKGLPASPREATVKNLREGVDLPGFRPVGSGERRKGGASPSEAPPQTDEGSSPAGACSS